MGDLLTLYHEAGLNSGPGVTACPAWQLAVRNESPV